MVVLDPRSHAHLGGVGGDFGRRDKCPALVLVRALERNVERVLDDDPHVPVNAAVHVEVPGAHRRDLERVVLPVVDGHREHIVLPEADQIRDIEVEAAVPPFVVADRPSVNPDLAVFLHTVELDEDLAPGLLRADREMLTIPAPPAPPVGIVLLGGIVDERVDLAGRFIRLPRVRHRHGRPGRIIEADAFTALAVGVRVREVVERPLAIDRLFDAMGRGSLITLSLCPANSSPADRQAHE